MRKWRGMALACSLALGCGGPLPEEDVQEGERSQASAPSEQGEGELGAMWERAEPGTARLVKDIFPPVLGPPWFGPFPESLTAFRGKLYFAANFEDGRRELWKSDGTSVGTVPVKKFPPLSGFSFPNSLTELTPRGSRLFFVVSDEEHGRELWVSDGSTGGTRLVKDIAPGSADASPFNLKLVGDTLLFLRVVPATPSTPERTELWKSDGTEAGTVRVKDLGPESSLIFSQTIVGDTLFFVLSDPEHGSELWKTDGTEAGTGLVRDIRPGADSSFPFHLTAVGPYVFFTVTTETNGSELWRSDGTPAGTVRVETLSPGPESFNPRLLGPIGNCLYLTLSDPSDHRLRLYKLKVDEAGGVSRRLVSTLPNPFADQPDSDPFITTFTVAGRKLFFAMAISSSGPAPRDAQLWVTDGTGSGTRLLHQPLSLFDEFGTTLHTLDDRVLFSGADDTRGLELWVSDGTVAGTRLLQELAPGGASSFPQAFTRVGTKLFFVANDAVHDGELWMLPLNR
ncbi:hypothetical protein JRI60_39995 [Archangium violaceum]|uniref:ELWxxDGT repeat protein n=1 Tax=Archangium violaceum TaxID=83451 RepID=UPI001950EA23|nr:ELWxxDGT repeat protein [Archangium violaceum]QRN95204.1 hypothetical protein JRI60_39995 [Archangium violaceum]